MLGAPVLLFVSPEIFFNVQNAPIFFFLFKYDNFDIFYKYDWWIILNLNYVMDMKNNMKREVILVIFFNKEMM